MTARASLLSAFSSFSASRRVAQIALLLVTTYAYRQLFLFDPNLQVPDRTAPAENFFFSFGATSPLLIYVLTVWFAARRIRQLPFSHSRSRSAAIGTTGILAAIALLFWGYYTGAFQVLPPSLGILLVSIGITLGGVAGGRALLVPSVFVVMLGTPVPTPLLNYMIYPMQLWTAEASVSFARLFGYAVLQSGDLILTPWAIFQVIETCAGLRSTLTLVMAAFVYCEILDVTPKRRLILLLVAPLIGVVANLARVLLLVFYPTPESQPEHSLQGILTTVVGVLILWGVDEAISFFSARSETSNAADRPDLLRRDHFTSASTRWIWGIAATLAIVGIASHAIAPRRVESLQAKSVHSIPRQIGAWSTGQNPLVVDSEYLGSVRFSNLTWREYRRGEDRVSLFIGDNDRVRRTDGLVSEKTKTLESGSFVMEETGNDANEVNSLVIQTRNGARWLARHRYENTLSLWPETLRSVFAMDRGPWRREVPSRVIQISTRFDASPGSRARANERLLEFEELLRLEISNLGGAD